MKKNKLSLKSFKVQSFVTSLENKEEQTIKGGATVEGCNPVTHPNYCNSWIFLCHTSIGC